MNESMPHCPHNLRNEIRELHRSARREQQRQYIAEGHRVCSDILNAGVIPYAVILRDGASDESKAIADKFGLRGADVFGSGHKDMDLMADASTSQDIMIVVPFVDEGELGKRVIVLDGVADPGNVGTIIRTASWFGFTDVVLGEGCADVYNPKVVRSTAGAICRINILRKRHLPDVMDELSTMPRIAAVARGGSSPSSLQGIAELAIIIGSEAQGVRPALLQKMTHTVSILGGNGTESLNAAIACAILLYEASR